jgi:polyferredoxin
MKKKPTAHSVARLAIQIVFFIFLPSLFSVAFNGVKYVADQIFRHETIAWNPFLATLTALAVFTVLFGRFFCGYACAFGSLGDWLFACSAFIRKKVGKKTGKEAGGRAGGKTGKEAFKLPDKAIAALLYLKYLILIGVVIACLLNVYSFIGPADPWGLFASLRAGGAGGLTLDGREWAAAALGAIVVGMLFVERFFCMFLCPMGAAFALLPMLPLTIYGRKKEDCIPGCSLCVRTCPASISLGEARGGYGDCFQCGKCAARCPKGNVRPGFRKLKGTEIWLAVLKAAALFAVCHPIMK